MHAICVKKFMLTGLIVLLGGQVYSQNFQSDNTNRGRRHRGFYLSWAGGVYSGNVDMSDNYGNTKVKGIGGVMDLKIGGTLTENLILHVTWLNHGLLEPKVYDESFGNSSVIAENTELSEIMIGGGLTYYTPISIFLSSSLGYGGFSASEEGDNDSASSEGGLCFQLKAGKEWWIARRWGIGLAAYYHKTKVHSNPNVEIDEKLNSNNFGIVFNATLNGK